MLKLLRDFGVTLLAILLVWGVALLLNTANISKNASTTVISKAPVFRVTDINARTSGSAFLIDVKGAPLLITNKHVCGVNNTEMRVDRGSFSDPKSFDATIVYTDSNVDICILSPDETFNADLYNALQISSSRVAIFDVIETVGYPRGVGPIYMEGFVEAIEVALSHPHSTSAYFSYTIRASFVAFGGQSGSPVLNEKGEVVGVLTYYFVNNASKAGIIPAADISYALRRAGIVK